MKAIKLSHFLAIFKHLFLSIQCQVFPYVNVIKKNK